MKSIALALLGLLPAAVAEVTHTGFEIRDDPRCTNGLGLEIDTLLCDDGTGATGTCDLGETAYMTGRLTIGNAGLFQRAIITSRACVFGLNWGDLTCNYYEFEADLCSVLGIYETYGECPDDGEWDVESSFNLPGFGNMHLGRGWWVVITSDIKPAYYEGGQESSSDIAYRCYLTVDAVDYDASSSASTYFLVGMSVMAVGGLASWLVRRRRTAAIDLAEEEQRAVSGGNFELMDSGVRV